jgi:fucose 4-O-acetylase-like acetyltransferase
MKPLNNNSVVKNQIVELDIAKGIGILLVVFGHALSKDIASTSIVLYYLRYCIYIVHMPLFFLVAGILFESNLNRYENIGLKPFTLKKLTTYIVPYLSFSLVAFVIEKVAFSYNNTAKLFINAGFKDLTILEFIKSLVTYNNPVDNHLWFSYVMFIVLVLAFIMRKVNLRLLVPVLYFVYALTWFFSFDEIVWKVMRYLFLFQVGRLIFRSKYIECKKNTLFTWLGFLGGFIGYCVMKYYGIYEPQCFVQPLAEICGAIILLKFSNLLVKTYISRFITYVGQNSYVIYLIHQPFVVPLVVKFLLMIGMPVYLTLLIASVIGVCLPLMIQKLIIERNSILKFLLLGKCNRS